MAGGEGEVAVTIGSRLISLYLSLEEKFKFFEFRRKLDIFR
jgi:hypothetical protein